jgi:hypothetical protein
MLARSPIANAKSIDSCSVVLRFLRISLRSSQVSLAEHDGLASTPKLNHVSGEW